MSEIVGGRYKLIKRLGVGGMAEVYLAEQVGPRGFARQAVIKRIHAHLAEDPVFVASFEQEARLAARLQHPHIVRTEDFGDDDGKLYIVLEYVQGDELASLAKHLNSVDQSLPLNLVLQIGVDIAEALDFAHKMPDAQGVPLEIVHRDVSPQNIMLTMAGQAKLLDFGIARAASNESITEIGMVKGKIAYFSPEQARGEHLDGRCDQFALAVLLFELLSRKRLFADKDVMSTLKRVNRCEVPSLRNINIDVPEAFDDALLRALSRKKTQRFGDCNEFSEALSDCLDEQNGRWSARKFKTWRAALPGPSEGTSAQYFSPLVLIENTVGKPSLNADTVLQAEPKGPASPPLTTPPNHENDATIVDDLTVVDQPAAADSEHSNIVEPLNSFFGRDEELDELNEHIDQDHRLITLVGAGGSGKTRLSQRFGQMLANRFAGGVWFCDLSEARSAIGLVSAMGGSLNLRLDQSNPETQIASALRGRGPCLIILDNVEQILDEMAAALKTWLQHAPKAVFLLTSRSALQLQSEVVILLDPLPIAEAMQLFYHRAQAVRPSFAASEANQPIIKEIVERLDCMALAVELAAARVRSLSPEQIRQHLKQRFRLLRGERRDQTARQATLQGTIDWSWNLLKPSEQSALTQLAVFRGGCTIEAAEKVIDLETFDDAPWVVDSVAALVDHSLLRRIEPVEGHSRYRMMESVREYALQKLGDDAPAVALRHAQYFATFGSEEFIDSLDTHGGVQQSQKLALEMENLVAGVENAIAASAFELAVCCALAAGVVYGLKGPLVDGIALLSGVFTEGVEAGFRARLLQQSGLLLLQSGQAPKALTHCEHAIAIHREMGNRRSEGVVLNNLGKLHYDQGRMAEALTDYEQAIIIAREVGNRQGEGVVLGNLGQLHWRQGRVTEALTDYEQAIIIAREVGNRQGEGVVLGNLSLLHTQQGRMAEALTHCEQTIVIAREVGNRRSEGQVLNSLGVLYLNQGRMAEALTHFEQAIAIARQVGYRRSEGAGLANLGLLRSNQGRTAEALTHYEQAIIIARELGSRRSEGVILGNVGDLLYVMGDLPAAEQHLQQAIEISDGTLPIAAGAFRGTLALIRAESGAFDQARALLERGDSQVRGVDAGEHAILLCKRARVEHLAGDAGAASAALAEAETIAEESQAGPDTSLGQELTKARTALAD